MLKKLFAPQSSVGGAAVILAAASLASRVIGLVRDRLFAHLFGAGDTLDVYYAAFRAPDFLYNLIIVGAVSAGFIPIFAEIIQKNKNHAWKVASAILNLLSIILALTGIVLFFTAPLFVPLMVPGFSPEKIRQTILLTKILCASPVILGVSSVVGSILQTMKSFAVYALSPILYNIGIMIGAIAFVPQFGIRGLAYGVILGALLHLLIQLPMLFSLGFAYQPFLSFRDPFVRRIMILMLPRTLGLAASQLNVILITMIASTLATGSITIFTFANNIQYVPVGLIGISYAIAAFPTLATHFALQKKEEFILQLTKTARLILFCTIPVSIAIVMLRIPIAQAAFGSGKFTSHAVRETASVLALFSVSLFAQCLIPLIVRAWYAVRNTWTPFVIGIIAEMITLGASLALKGPLGVSGLAIAFSISSVVQVILLSLLLRKKLGHLHGRALSLLILKTGIAGGVMTVAMRLVMTIVPLRGVSLIETVTELCIVSAIGGIVYWLLCMQLRIEETSQIIRMSRKALARLRGVPEVEMMERM